MIYPKKINANKSGKVLKWLLISSIILAIILLIINELTSPQIRMGCFS